MFKNIVIIILLVILSIGVVAQNDFVIPTLVNLYPSTNSLYVIPEVSKEYFLTIESRSDSPLTIDIVPDEELSQYMMKLEGSDLMDPKGQVTWKWRIETDEVFTESGVGVLVVDLEDGQELIEVDLVLESAPLTGDVEEIIFLAAIAIVLVIVYKIWRGW